jgi:[ribosomal protein S18]-alanine N-acetyltransferase
MPAEIRLARASDVDALAALENTVFEADRISRKSFRSMVDSASAIVLVAAAQDAIAGYCTLLFRAGSRKARLYSLAAARGSGIGRALLAAAEETAARRGCEELRLEVREDNARAIDLYEKSGYRRFGRKPDYYADGTAALLYEKPLHLAEPAAILPKA